MSLACTLLAVLEADPKERDKGCSEDNWSRLRRS